MTKQKIRNIFIYLLTFAMIVGVNNFPLTVKAATQNKVLEIPIKFSGAHEFRVDYDYWNENSETTYNLRSISDPVSNDTEDYKIGFKLYIPAYIFDNNKNASIVCFQKLRFIDADTKKYKIITNSPIVKVTKNEIAVVDFDTNTVISQQEYMNKGIFVNGVINKANDFYIADISMGLMPEYGFIYFNSNEAKPQKVIPEIMYSIFGFSIEEDSNVYVDDLTINSKSTDLKLDFDVTTPGQAFAGYKVNGKTKYNNTLNISTIKNNTILSVKKSTITVKRNKKVSLGLTVVDTNKTTYKSANNKIATVNKAGVVTGKKAGKTTITVTSGGITKKIKVVVK